jgi:Putative motility protein
MGELLRGNIMADLGIAGLASNVAESGVKQQVGISVLKKALDIESSTALTLIQAVSAPNLPPNLGNNVNTTA